MARGGKREGSGRKPGKTYRLSDYVTETDRKTFVEFMLENYMGDMRLATWVGDHLFSKPPMAVTGDDGGPIEITLVKYVPQK